MKQNTYIFFWIILGILAQFVVHALLEMSIISMLLTDFESYNIGLSWSGWYTVHYYGTIILLVAGVYWGYAQGKRYWGIVYENNAL